MKVQKESQAKTREQFANNPQLKIKKSRNHKERRTKKNDSFNTKNSSKSENSENISGTPGTESNEKTAELNPIFIQSLLKESKLKVNKFNLKELNNSKLIQYYLADEADACGKDAGSGEFGTWRRPY